MKQKLSPEPIEQFISLVCKTREITQKDIAHKMGVDVSSFIGRQGMSIYLIDRIATALNSHPVLIYGDDWLDLPIACCPRGHEMTEDNVYKSTRSDGRAQEDCKTCRRNQQNTARQRKARPDCPTCARGRKSLMNPPDYICWKCQRRAA